VSTGNIRRAQLVTPFGVGAMSVLVNGTSVITAGLDHWYQAAKGSELDVNEYVEHDWRLETRLRVQGFRLPPDYRFSGGGDDRRNLHLTVPVLRFPRWNFCMYCKRLKRSPLTLAQQETCPDVLHSHKAHKPRMTQVPFVAICPHGHLDDFPFDKWVHRSHEPVCTGVLRLVSRGGGLEGQVVKCGGCGMERHLSGILDGRRDPNGEERTTLTDQLCPGTPYYCPGARPWVAEEEGTCGEPIRGALRAAGNVYFPKVESSIYLPRKDGAVSAEMHELMRRADVSPVLRTLHNAFGESLTVDQMREALPPELFDPISDEDLLAAFQDLFGVGEEPLPDPGGGTNETLTGDDEWRYPEFQRIRDTPKDDYLTATDPGVHVDLQGHIGQIRSVDALRETRALRGFTRVRDDGLKLNAGKALLRRRPLKPNQDWLPAYVVKGEGIYVELEPERLAAWETRAEVQARADRITAHFGVAAKQRGAEERNLSPRFVLLHTLGHLLINELVFTCGYSSASLRERLYVSNAPSRDMAGLLIYTAAGDSEGTMGGLVRMARPGNLRPVMASAVSNARWCSTDPVCMDMGEKGQGPDSCNLAACHGCALLPETSCEEFNRFLDRALVIGTFSDPDLGFFSEFGLS
jgi:hypothetical protein